MEPKGNQMDPKGDQMDPKGSQMDPKGSQTKPKVAPRETKGAPKTPKGSQGDKLYIHKLPINRPSGRYVREIDESGIELRKNMCSVILLEPRLKTM